MIGLNWLNEYEPRAPLMMSELKQIVSPFLIVCGVLAAVIMAM